MTLKPENLDLSILPPEYRGVFEAQAAWVKELEEINKRLEHLVAELNHAVHGKRSEKLSEDERQLVFEDLQVAISELEAQKEAASATPSASRKKSTPPLSECKHLPAGQWSTATGEICPIICHGLSR